MVNKKLALALAGIGVLTLQACGGGASTTETTPEKPATTTVPVTVIDGPIHKAQVCLDTNNNGACDTGEPNAETDASGKANLVVDSTLAGKYPVIAVVGTNAIDMDRPSDPITTPFTMKAPADKPSVITPLTTLVQEQINTTGATSTEAEKQVKQQTGINVSLFEDFTKGSTGGHKFAATLARMVVVTTQKQFDIVKDDKDANNVAISKADLDKAVQQALMTMLPKLVEALQDPTVTAATDAKDKEAALRKKAEEVVLADGIQVGGAATAIAINKGAAETSRVPQAGISLAQLSTTDAHKWYFRLNTASVKQDTPDANGNLKYVTRRFSSAGDAKQNAVAVWSTGSDPRRQADLHWNGTKWANCDINFEHTATVRDAKGRNSYNYCDNREIGTTLRTNVDVSGAPMFGAYKAVRSAGYNNLKIGESDNIAAEQLLSNSVFPANSQIQYTSFTTTDFAISYYPGTDNAVALSPAAVAAGDKTACEKDNGTSNILATTLEDLVSRGTGTPCVFTANASTGSRNEGWGSTVMSMGTVGTMSTQAVATETLTAANYYTSNRRLRVAFGANNAANYYSCQERLNASTRNCDLVGTGSYAIETLGDARVMTFNGLPPIFSTLDYTRVFVERAGKIWHGYKVRPRVAKQARLNTAAAKAILTQLNLNTDFSAGTNTDPETQLKPTKASYQGVWNLSFGTASGPKPDVTVKDDGSIGCKIATTDPALATGCVAFLTSSGLLTLTKTATGFDPALTTSIQLDFLSGTGTGSYQDFVSTTNGTAGAARK